MAVDAKSGRSRELSINLYFLVVRSDGYQCSEPKEASKEFSKMGVIFPKEWHRTLRRVLAGLSSYPNLCELQVSHHNIML